MPEHINNILVIIPTYNEAGNIQTHLECLLKTYPSIDVLVVDDGSPDGTADLVQALSRKHKRLSLINRTKKTGLGDAYLAGFAWALSRNYQIVIEMDADGSHLVSELGLLLDASREFDLVIGSRWMPGGEVQNWPRYRQAISKFGNFYARLMLGTNLSDMTAGFRAFRASFLRQLDTGGIAAHGYAFQVELAYRAHLAGARIGEVPVTFVERTQGKSKMSSRIVMEALVLVTSWGLKRLFRRS
jgi:dolichol-phosphate mannosyltransferase